MYTFKNMGKEKSSFRRKWKPYLKHLEKNNIEPDNKSQYRNK